ncbi:Uncharacterised protein [uncultured archaeon]|nr:Uncharacterised protein [uncultured archaeon]
MKRLLMVIAGIAIALFGLSQFAHADFAVGFGSEGYSFELYNGAQYTYSSMPYTYVSGDYYYFDYPFRVNYTGTYSYYPSGWYSFGNYWTPGCAGCYSYYPPTYYYYNSAWAYSPNWIYTYGPAYYGHYYYPPQQPSLVGQQYKPAQEASCNEIEITANDVSLKTDRGTAQIFYIKNNSAMHFDIFDASVKTGSGISAMNVSHDSTIVSNSTGKMEFTLSANPGADNGTVELAARIRGAFRDGTNCSFGDTSKYFNATVYGASDKGSTAKNQYATGTTQANSYAHDGSGNTGNGEGYAQAGNSEAFYQAKKNVQAWNDATATSEGQNNGADATAKATQYKGRGNSNPGMVTSASFSGNDPMAFYGNAKAADCSGLSITPKNISVKAGSSASDYFTLRNYSNEEFIIGSLDAVGYSPDFFIETYRENNRAYAGETSAINVKALAESATGEATGSAYIKMKGHFADGRECEINSESFYVKVNAPGEGSTAKISLFAPGTAEIKGTAGFVEFSFENLSGNDAKAIVSAEGANASPREIALPANSSGKRQIALNGIMAGGNAIVYIKVPANAQGNAGTIEKRIAIKALPAEKSHDVNTPVNANSAGANNAKAGSGVLRAITNIAGTGFAAISGNAFYLGFSVLLILFFAWVAYRVSTK